jgi:glycosyltransferase involved in cell wall biosynthesis
MRIGIFSEAFEPVQNGVSTSVRTLVDELRTRHHHAVVVAPHYPDYEDEIPFVLRVPSFQTRFNADYPVAYPWLPRLRREFGRLQPDIIHSHQPFFLGRVAAGLAQQNGVPLVSTYHTFYNHYGHYIFFLPDHAIQGLLRWWIPDYYNRCVEVIVPSRLAEESLRQYGVVTPVTVIPTAVPLPSLESVDEAATQAARARWNIPPSAPLLLYVGRMAQEKNLELVLHSFEAVADEFPEARLLMVGGGPYLEHCRKQVRGASAAGRMIFAGPVPRDELDPVFAASDLFVFGSCTETQGLVVAEARAAGTPAVVVNRGGAAETVRDGEDGLVVEPEPEAFAEAIRMLLRDAARRSALRKACHRNAHHYTPAAMVDGVLAVYERAIEAFRSQKTMANSRK